MSDKSAITTFFFTLILMFALSACSNQEVSHLEQPFSFKPGTYTGMGKGYKGNLTVEVTVTKDAIFSVVVTDNKETERVAYPALEEIPSAIVENQSTDVDEISGATVTSKAIKQAVADALSQATADAP